VAYAHYHYLRAARPRERYYQVTDAELAGRIASELELVAVVDPESEVHAWVDREGDPLHFLRGRARRAGRHFGVSGGKLFFTRAVPPPPDATAVIGPLDLVALEVWAGGAGGRGGKLEAAGDADWQPLRQFQLRGAGEMDGGYRAVRCAHVLDGSGCRTVVEFLEEGLDLDAWRRGGAA
jgi:hypothetical protein